MQGKLLSRKSITRALYHDGVTDFLRWRGHQPDNQLARQLLRRPDLLNKHLLLVLLQLGREARAPEYVKPYRGTPKAHVLAALEWLGGSYYRKLVSRVKNTPLAMSHLLMFRRAVIELHYNVRYGEQDILPNYPVFPSVEQILSLSFDFPANWHAAQLHDMACKFWRQQIGAADNQRVFSCPYDVIPRQRPSIKATFKHPFLADEPLFFDLFRSIVIREAGIVVGGRGNSYADEAQRIRQAMHVPDLFEPLYQDLDLILAKQHPDWMALACLMTDVDFSATLTEAEIRSMPEA